MAHIPPLPATIIHPPESDSWPQPSNPAVESSEDYVQRDRIHGSAWPAQHITPYPPAAVPHTPMPPSAVPMSAQSQSTGSRYPPSNSSRQYVYPHQAAQASQLQYPSSHNDTSSRFAARGSSSSFEPSLSTYHDHHLAAGGPDRHTSRARMERMRARSQVQGHLTHSNGGSTIAGEEVDEDGNMWILVFVPAAGSSQQQSQ